MSGLRAAAIGVLVTVSPWCAATSAHAAGAPATLHVPVAVCDAGHVPSPLMAAAERIAGDAYREIGVTLDWIDEACGVGERGLSVNLIARSTSEIEVSNLTLGFAEPGTSAATVLYDRVDAFARHYHVRPEVLLGYVIAHELGHLLLPPHSHSAAGLMRATLDMERAGAQELRFTHEQGELIVGKIEALPVALATH